MVVILVIYFLQRFLVRVIAETAYRLGWTEDGAQGGTPMRITAMDIRQQQFTVRVFRGFDPQEVDAFLEDMADDYEELIKENALLKEQLATVEEKPAASRSGRRRSRRRSSPRSRWPRR